MSAPRTPPHPIPTLGILVTGFLLGALLQPLPARAGGRLEALDITGRQPGPGEGEIIARIVPQHLDSRCIPLAFRLNDTLDPIPNPLGADFLSLAETVPAFEEAMARWTDLPTSYVDLRLEGTTDNPGFRRFDMIPELTFRTPPGFDFFASTVTTCLAEDLDLLPGTDLDGDGDGDVVAGIEVCRDFDGDGDLELPAGFYRAGTILDTDIQFNSPEFAFTVGDDAINTDAKSVDLLGLALHELGHTHGLAHALSNQLSDTDGTQVVMFPFIDAGDPVDQRAVQNLRIEDVATTSFFYPEGSAADGPAALQSGDRAFDEVFAVLEGEAFHGVQQRPLVGASVFAVNAETGIVEGSAITGAAQVLVDVADGVTYPIPSGAVVEILDGKWALPLPFGYYRLGIEPVDGQPVSSVSVNRTTDVGSRLGQTRFPEELYNGPLESDVETRPGYGVILPALPRQPGALRSGIRFTTNRVSELGSGFTRRTGFFRVDPGLFLAVRFPAELILSATGGEPFAVVAARVTTLLTDRGAVARYRRALLVTGTVDETTGTALLDLGAPLASISPFIAQDNDKSPWFFDSPRRLGAQLRRMLEHGDLDDVFLVVEGPEEPLPGPNLAAPFVPSDASSPGAGRSYSSTDGVLFHRESGDVEMDLLLSALPPGP